MCLKWSYAIGLTMLPPRTINYLTKQNPSTRHQKPDGGLNENAPPPQSWACEHLVPSWWRCWGGSVSRDKLRSLGVHPVSGVVVEDVSTRFSNPGTMPAGCCLLPWGTLTLWSRPWLVCFLSLWENIAAKSSLGSQGFISVYSCRPLWRESDQELRVESRRQELKKFCREILWTFYSVYLSGTVLQNYSSMAAFSF